MDALDDWIDAHYAQIRTFLTLGPSVIGAFPITGLINPFWGSLFGFPMYWAAAGHPIYGPHPWTETAAFVLWPIILIAAMAWLSGRLLDLEHVARKWLVLAWAASAFLVLPFHLAAAYFHEWPIYGPFE